MAVCDQFIRRAAPARPRSTHGVSLTWIADTDDGPTSWNELAHLDWSRFRLVLGAGGATGAAFEAGVLLALSTDHGIDLQKASHLVGTSAGSVLAALVAMGLAVDDLAALVAGVPQWLSPSADAYKLAFGTGGPPAPRLRNLMRLMGPRDLVKSAGLAASRHYRALWLHCVKPGTYDLTGRLPFIPNMAWPSEGRLSICCTDSANAERVVYDRESDVNLADAVAASCAVPGVMRPVGIGNRVLVDGGVVSPTNADLAFDDDGAPGVTVVVSPMSGTGSHSAIGRASTIFASNRLQAELRRSHLKCGVLLIEPAGALGALVIDDALNDSIAPQILTSSFLAPSQARIKHRRLARHAGSVGSARSAG